MHHPILLTVAAVASFVLGAKAQSGRYRDLVFPSAVVQSDIQYGAAFNPTTQVLEPLLLDLSEPANDAATARPAVVIVHGGGFVGGDKTAVSMQRLGADFARRVRMTSPSSVARARTKTSSTRSGINTSD